MADWTAFGAVVGVVLTLLLVLSWLTQRGMNAVGEPPALPAGEPGSDPEPNVVSEPKQGAVRVHEYDETREETTARHPGLQEGPAAETLTGEQTLSGAALLANVAASQGTFTVVLLLAAVATGVPAAALGVTSAALEPDVLAAGAGLGVALSAANQGAVALFRRLDVGFSEELRSLLAPASLGGWAALLLGVLPLVALFEELLFRAILIGGFATGFGIDPWVLVVVSSMLFAAGHGAQGAAGIVVTGVLGLVLGAAFVVTESLAAVVLAHYLVNALEFVLHER